MVTLRFKESVKKDFRHIGREVVVLILQAIRKKLLPDPKTAGKPLKGQYGTLWIFRVGEYRVLYVFDDKEVWVLVVRIGRKEESLKECRLQEQF